MCENSMIDIILPTDSHVAEDDLLTQWKVDEMLNGYQNGEFGHVIALFISLKDRDDFVADEYAAA